MSLINIIRLMGAVALVVIVIAVWMIFVSRQFEKSPGPFPGGFESRVMALEFIDAPESKNLILGPNLQHNSAVMHKLISIDFAWIGAYALLYIMVGWLLCRRNCPWAFYLATVAVVSGLAAALFDVRENLAMSRVLDQAEVTQAMVNSVRDASLTKWILSFVAMAILATTFYGLNRKATWIGYAFTLTAVIGLAGLWHRPFTALMGIPMLLGLIALAIVAFWRPNDLKETYS